MQYGDVKIKLLEKDDRLNFSTFFFFFNQESVPFLLMGGPSWSF